MENMHPARTVCIGLAMIMFMAIATGAAVLQGLSDKLEGTEELLLDVQERQALAEERSYINRAIAGCSDIINDEEIEITEECVDPRVAAYSTPSICEKLPREVKGCGSKAKVVT